MIDNIDKLNNPAAQAQLKQSPAFILAYIKQITKSQLENNSHLSFRLDIKNLDEEKRTIDNPPQLTLCMRHSTVGHNFSYAYTALHLDYKNPTERQLLQDLLCLDLGGIRTESKLSPIQLDRLNRYLSIAKEEEEYPSYLDPDDVFCALRREIPKELLPSDVVNVVAAILKPARLGVTCTQNPPNFNTKEELVYLFH
ncbi:MAG: hypothetical protein NTW08_01735 [Gammaproteobacteria bacterium]|nr:hypothetical protein [Gammaproteobacteria bacterium]